jgi:hypothetical protein
MSREPQTDPSLASRAAVSSSALDRRLLLYSVAAGATIACATPAKAEVIFTPSSVHLSSGSLAIDLDNDGSDDFTLIVQGCRSGSEYQFLNCLGAYGNRNNQILGSRFGGRRAGALDKGTLIQGRPDFRANLLMATGFGYFGYWADVTDGYLGCKLKISGEAHYAWIGFRRVTASFGHIHATLGGWAYESEPNKAIVAGDTGNGMPTGASIHPSSLEILAAGHSGVAERRKRLKH